MPSRLSPRLRLRKLEMWACLKPVCSASRRPVRSPSSMRCHKALRRLSCRVRNFIGGVYHAFIAMCYCLHKCNIHKEIEFLTRLSPSRKGRVYLHGQENLISWHGPGRNLLNGGGVCGHFSIRSES